MKPHGEAGGNSLLFSVHEIDVLDKHRKPVPIGDYTRLTGEFIKKKLFGLSVGDIECGMSNRDIVWKVTPLPWWPEPFIEKEY